MANDSVVIRFNEVSFTYPDSKQTLDEASFSVRTGMKVALMGQNGAGKSTLFKLMLGELKPNEGGIFMTPPDATVGIAKQVIPPEMMDLTVRDYFAQPFGDDVPYNLDKRIADAFEAVNFTTDLKKKVRAHSGGQHARLLLAYAIVRQPDILLLDEPTNNLDAAGIEHLTGFLMMYDKTVIVISHDADFLNAFTDGVLYLDAHTHKVEKYDGNYTNVVEEIAARVERERQQNARAELEIRKKREQAEVFAHKGGRLRSVAKRMREAAEEAEESKVEERREDKTIRDFTIPCQEFAYDWSGKILELKEVGIVKDGEPVNKEVEIVLRRKSHILIEGPNGIGKSTLLQKIAAGKTGEIDKSIKVGYYQQDFSMLDYGQKGYDSLFEVMPKKDEQFLRTVAAGFLLDGKIIAAKIGSYSEGQKALLAFARLVLMKPGLLILDEPTNHVNFRHLPVIAKALDQYEGAMILVSHIPDFVGQIRIDQRIDLGVL